MVLPIYLYGSEILRKKAEEVDISNMELRDEIRQLIEDMKETMTKADGVGLAAPQVGKSIRVIVVDGALLGSEDPKLAGFNRAMINPVILEESQQTVEYNEGCLSIPDIHAAVVRSEMIKVSYYDTDFVEHEEILNGFACRMVQHEISHLDGLLFTDLVAPIRKKMIQSRLNNIKSGKVNTFYKAIVK